jgi:nitroimidazol reductase NimA-like FMN-containing flavoprotein (pyridoxamine 5'-phosphate oxidase superfamily)
MWQDEGNVELLDEGECWSLLGEQSLGRLAVCAAKEIDIFPINFHADGNNILLRTAQGTKLLEMAVNGHVALETDGYTDQEAWSVVVKGEARRLERQTEIDAADQRPLKPWIPTLKYVYVEITPTKLTGRRFERAEEPDRFA